MQPLHVSDPQANADAPDSADSDSYANTCPGACADSNPYSSADSDSHSYPGACANFNPYSSADSDSNANTIDELHLHRRVLGEPRHR